jgi:hypothetical protein
MGTRRADLRVGSDRRPHGCRAQARPPVRLSSWRPTWRLLGIAMPVTIVTTGLLSWWFLGLTPATAPAARRGDVPDRPSARQQGGPARGRATRTTCGSPSPPKPGSTTASPSRSPNDAVAAAGAAGVGDSGNRSHGTRGDRCHPGILADAPAGRPSLGIIAPSMRRPHWLAANRPPMLKLRKPGASTDAPAKSHPPSTLSLWNRRPGAKRSPQSSCLRLSQSRSSQGPVTGAGSRLRMAIRASCRWRQAPIPQCSPLRNGPGRRTSWTAPTTAPRGVMSSSCPLWPQRWRSE